MTKFQKFIFFLSALIPGAGHMYLGFMKRGLLLMTVFFVDIGLSMILNGFLVFMPVIWFYCLFDAWNKYHLTDSEKKKVDDSLFFFYNAISSEPIPQSSGLSNSVPQKFYRILGSAAIYFGIIIICNEVRENIDLPLYASRILAFMPEFLISLALIFIGIKLILHKKKEICAWKKSTVQKCTKEAPCTPAPTNLPDPEPQKAECLIEPLEKMTDESISEVQSYSSDLEPVKPLSNSKEAQKIDLVSKDILRDIHSSLTPLEDSIESEDSDDEIEYIWSSPVKTDDNPQ